MRPTMDSFTSDQIIQVFSDAKLGRPCDEFERNVGMRPQEAVDVLTEQAIAECPNAGSCHLVTACADSGPEGYIEVEEQETHNPFYDPARWNTRSIMVGIRCVSLSAECKPRSDALKLRVEEMLHEATTEYPSSRPFGSYEGRSSIVDAKTEKITEEFMKPHQTRSKAMRDEADEALRPHLETHSSQIAKAYEILEEAQKQTPQLREAVIADFRRKWFGGNAIIDVKTEAKVDSDKQLASS